MSAPAFKGFVSINAATATGAGAALNVPGNHKTYGLQVVLGGTVVATGCVVTVQGSNDGGTTFFTLGTWSLAGGQSAGDIVFAVDKPVGQIRANCTTLSGGTNPTVSAYLITS